MLQITEFINAVVADLLTSAQFFQALQALILQGMMYRSRRYIIPILYLILNEQSDEKGIFPFPDCTKIKRCIYNTVNNELNTGRSNLLNKRNDAVYKVHGQAGSEEKAEKLKDYSDFFGKSVQRIRKKPIFASRLSKKALRFI